MEMASVGLTPVKATTPFGSLQPMNIKPIQLVSVLIALSFVLLAVFPQSAVVAVAFVALAILFGFLQFIEARKIDDRKALEARIKDIEEQVKVLRIGKQIGGR